MAACKCMLSRVHYLRVCNWQYAMLDIFYGCNANDIHCCVMTAEMMCVIFMSKLQSSATEHSELLMLYIG